MKFNAHHEADLLWYYREAGGDLGISSSLGPMINMTISGIQQGGRANPEFTRATMDNDPNAPVERQRRIKYAIGALDAAHQKAIKAMYDSRKAIERKGNSPKEAGAWRSDLAPEDRLFGELGAVVVALKLAQPTSLELDRNAVYRPSKGKKIDAVEARAVAARVADAKKAIARATSEATKALDAARVAYAAAAHDVPPPKARRSLENYAVWCGGGQ
jgi:hypothetical protein